MRGEDLAAMVEAEVVAVGLDPTATTSTEWEEEVGADGYGSNGCDLNKVGKTTR